MAKKERTLTQTEILAMAIRQLSTDCEKWDQMIKTCNDPKLAKQLREDNEMFWKFKKLLELYKIQTGSDYALDFDYDFLKEG